MNSNAVQRYINLREDLDITETGAAILVLAEAIEGAATFNRQNAENFGHELALALKAAMADGTLTVVRYEGS
jgi:hypothetical protein